MKTIRHWILVLFSTLMLLPSAKTQTVYSQVSSKRVQVGVPFEYAIVISVNASNYTPPNFKDFEVVSGPNQSSSVQYVNGAITQQMVISFGLLARKEGKFTIGPAYVTANGQRYEAAAVNIEVTKNGGGQGGGDQHGGAGISGEDLFIRTTVSKTKVYLGEQITIVQKVYSRNQIIGYQKSNPPAYDGFYSQAQDSPTRGQLIMENVDGVNYYTHEIFRTIAIANKSGRIQLNPIELVPIIRRQSANRARSVFEQFFGGASYDDVPVPIKSKAQVVEVMDLPEDGRPESFNGAVGNFVMRTEVSRTTLKANEAFNLKLIISGKGNLKLVNPPKLSLPESFESYDPRVNDNVNSKTFDYLIIPREQGDFKLNKLEFSYFNLDTKKYVAIPSPEIDIKVLAPDASGAGAQVYTPRNQVKETENDIRYIKKGDFLMQKSRDEFFNSPLHLGLLAFPVAALFGGWYARRTHIRNNSNLVLVRERKAGGAARRQLRNAEKLKTQGNKDGFYAEVLTALNNYLSHKLNIPAADLSRERVLSLLQQRQVKDETRASLVKTLDTAEYARYAPGAVSGDLNAVFSDIVQLVTSLEQQLNRKAA